MVKEVKRIEVDIGAAMKMLEASPELAEQMNQLVGGPALVAAQARIERLEAALRIARVHVKTPHALAAIDFALSENMTAKEG